MRDEIHRHRLHFTQEAVTSSSTALSVDDGRRLSAIMSSRSFALLNYHCVGARSQYPSS